MLTWQEIADDPSNVAVYRWVIIQGKQLLNIHPANGVNQGDHPPYGVWISKNSSQKDYTYIARLNSGQHGWKASFGCTIGDGGILEAKYCLELNDRMKKEIGWKWKDEEGGSLESGPSQEAKKVADDQIQKPSKRAEAFMTLDIPSPDQGGTRDDNGNDLLRFAFIHYPAIHYPDGFEGTQQEDLVLWWAKKEVPGKQYTVLTDAEVLRLKFDGKIEHMDGEEFSI